LDHWQGTEKSVGTKDKKRLTELQDIRKRGKKKGCCKRKSTLKGREVWAKILKRCRL